MIKILHIIEQLTLGGAGRTLIATSKMVSRFDDYAHQVISIKPPQHQAAALAIQSGIQVLSEPENETLLGTIATADILQVHWWNTPEIYEFLLSDLPPTRFMLWCHVAGDRTPHIISPKLVEFADLVVACNPYTFKELSVFNRLPDKIKKEKIALVYAGADFERLRGIQPREHLNFNVGYIGTIDFVKMHPHYISMSAAVKMPNVRFLVCGGGQIDLLREQAQKLGAAERFEFCGYVTDIRAVLELLDVFGYPLCENTYAGSELVLQEAMYAGIPPVVFPHGGIKGMVEHNQNGLVVKSEAEYTQAIEYLHAHPEERHRLGKNAAHYACNVMGVENAAKDMHTAYQKMLQAPKSESNWVGNPYLSSIKFLRDDMNPNWQATISAGSDLFIESLGEGAQDFITSKFSEDLREILEAEQRIASSNLLMVVQGILKYRDAYLSDGHLRLWAGLVLMNSGRYQAAHQELAMAADKGCDHWRVNWYLALSADKMNKPGAAVYHLRSIINIAPAFPALQQMQQRLQNMGYGFEDFQGHSQKSRTNHSIFHTGLSKTRPQTKLLGQQPMTEEESGPLISAIVSTYNAERFIRGCLEDLVSQTIADKLEIIVVDSGSEQNEAAVTRAFQGQFDNIHYIRCEKRETVYAAWNRGIQLAKGKYITNANTDDRHRLDAFERMANVLEAKPDVALVYADVLKTQTENETFEKCHPSGEFRWYDWDRNILLKEGCFIGPQPMWRRSVHDRYGGFDETLVTSGDYEFWLRISQTFDFYHIRMPLGLYLVRSDSIEHRELKTKQLEDLNIRRAYTDAAQRGIRIHNIKRFASNPEYSDDIQTKHSLTIGENTDQRPQGSRLNPITSHPIHKGGVHMKDYETVYQALQPLFNSSRVEDAIAALENFVSSYPNFARAHHDLGSIYYENDEKDKALAQFELAAQLEPQNAVFKKNLADFYYVEQNRIEAALALYNEIVKVEPVEAETLLTAGHLCVALQQFGEAQKMYERALSLQPENAEVHQILEKLQKIEKTRLAPSTPEIGQTEPPAPINQDLNLKDMVGPEQMNPDDVLAHNARHNLAKLQAIEPTSSVPCISENGQTSARTPLAEDLNLEAMSELEQKISRNPDDALAHNDLGVLYYHAKEKEKALKHYEQATKLEPSNVLFQKNLADFYFVEMGLIEEALKIYVNILTIEPEDIETLMNTGQICLSLNKFEDAKVFFNRVLEIEPWNAAASEKLDEIKNMPPTGAQEHSLGEHEHSQAGQEHSPGGQDSNPDEIYQEIYRLLNGNDTQAAIHALEKFLALFPEYALAHNDLGVLYYNSGQKENSKNHYEKAAELQPGNITFQKNLADYYYVEEGRVEDALKLYVQILEIEPQDIETLMITGHICVALHKFDDAKVFYNRVLEIEPWNADARENLDKLDGLRKAV